MQYNPAFTFRRPILSEEDSRGLHALALACPLGRFLADARNYAVTETEFPSTVS